MSGPTTPDLAKIAEGLTKAQRTALESAFLSEARKVICIRAHRTVQWNLCRQGLCRDYIGAPALTPLGLALREHLQQTKDRT